VFGLVRVAGLNSKARIDGDRDSHGINGATSRPLPLPANPRGREERVRVLLINDGNSGILGCSIHGKLCKKSIPQCSFGERATSLDYKTAAETHAARRGGKG